MSGVMRTLRVALVVPLLLVAGACGEDKPAVTPSAQQSPAAVASPAPGGSADAGGDPAARAAAAVAAMADADLAGQVLMPYAYGTGDRRGQGRHRGNQNLAGVDTPAEMVNKFRLGGLILVGLVPEDPTACTNPTSNVENPPSRCASSPPACSRLARRCPPGRR